MESDLGRLTLQDSAIPADDSATLNPLTGAGDDGQQVPPPSPSPTPPPTQSSWRTAAPPPPPLHYQIGSSSGGNTSSTHGSTGAAAAAAAAASNGGGSDGCGSGGRSGGGVGLSIEERLLQLEQREAASSKRIEALEASAHIQRKVVCEVLLQDLAHDDRAMAAITRVKQLLQRTFPERIDSGVVWLGNGSCTLASLAPETLIHVLEYLKCKFGRTALSKVAPVFWMPQPNLRAAKSLSSFVKGYGQAIVTLSGHKGTYVKFMGMYELDLRHIVHGYPLFKKMGMASNPHFIYKCSLNGKWLVTDEEDHCPKNLSRIGTKFAAESPDEPGMDFEVWQDGAWVTDPNLVVSEGRVKNFSNVITFQGHTGQQSRFMGTYEIDPLRVVHGYPLYRRRLIKRNNNVGAASLSHGMLSQNRGPENVYAGGGSSSSSNGGSAGVGGGGQGGQNGAGSAGGNGSSSSSSSSSSIKEKAGADRKDFVYKCSINGKWLVTDDDDHFAMNLSRIGTEGPCENLVAVNPPYSSSSSSLNRVSFEVWRNGSWHKDPFLKVVSGEGGGGIEESITAIASSSTTSMADSASYYARLAANVAGAAAV